MNEDKNFILYSWNNETKEFYFLGHKIDYIHNPSEWRKYLNDLVTENQKYKEVIDKANNKLNSFIECCKAEKLESGSDYLHHSYWDMFERFNKQIKDILKELE